MTNITIENIKNLSSEKLVDLIYFNKIEIPELINKINKSLLNEVEKTSLIKKIEVAKIRLESPLDLSQTILFLIFPFGITSIFNNDYESDYKQFLKFNYKRKIKQYFQYSIIGFATYIVLAIIIALINW